MKKIVEDLVFSLFVYPKNKKIEKESCSINLVATGNSLDHKIGEIKGVNIGCNWLNKKYGDAIYCKYYLFSDPVFFNDVNIDYVIDVVKKSELTFMPFQSFVKNRKLWKFRAKLFLLNFNNTYLVEERKFNYDLSRRLHCANTVLIEFGIPVSLNISSSKIKVYGFDLIYNPLEDLSTVEWRSQWVSDVNKAIKFIPKNVMDKFEFCGEFKIDKSE